MVWSLETGGGLRLDCQTESKMKVKEALFWRGLQVACCLCASQFIAEAAAAPHPKFQINYLTVLAKGS